jgi:predicted N-acetyltransferase YhbS
MTEIRPIREGEAESFLDLLCNVFDLDYPRAHSIFFAEPLFDLDRKWALIQDGEILSILTTVPLEFGWGRAIGVAGVATAIDKQGQGLAGRLLATVIEESGKNGETSVMLFARDRRLYERLGFEPLDEVVRGPIAARPERVVPLSLDFEQVRDAYDAWASADEARLRRDELRWKYWKWNLRVCTPFHEGYMCFEGGTIREVVLHKPTADWELPIDAEWLGLRSMKERLGAELTTSTTELHLMGLRVPAAPQFFMTDQF